jgi:tetratricopeptide (TPR) repeat protein
MPRQQQVEVLNQALRAFDRGVELRAAKSDEAREQFAEAAVKFQMLVDAGIRNGRLYYDLANAHLLADHLGEAIANYRRAERLIPSDPRLQENLRYARTLCRNQIPLSGEQTFWKTLLFWHYRSALRSRIVTALVAYVLFWMALVGWVYWRRNGWWFLLAACLAVWLAAGASSLIELYHPPPRAGVIVAENTIVRKGNGEGFEPQFREPLHPGVEFTVREQRDDWVQIELNDGKSGWIQISDADLL